LKIEKKEVEYVAHLARLEFQAGEMDKFTSQMNDILIYMDKLSEVNTEGVIPLSSGIAMANAFRDDGIRDSLSYDQAMANAPEVRENCFIVPKVVE